MIYPAWTSEILPLIGNKSKSCWFSSTWKKAARQGSCHSLHVYFNMWPFSSEPRHLGVLSIVSNVELITLQPKRTSAFSQWGPRLKGHETSWTQKSKDWNFSAASLLSSLSGIEAFKRFLFSDPLRYLWGLHQISWHTISGWEAGSSSILNSALFSCLTDGYKHTTLVEPLQLRPALYSWLRKQRQVVNRDKNMKWEIRREMFGEDFLLLSERLRDTDTSVFRTLRALQIATQGLKDSTITPNHERDRSTKWAIYCSDYYRARRGI